MRRLQKKKELGKLLDHGSEEIKPNHSFHGPYKASGVLQKWPSTAQSLSDAQLEKKQGRHSAAERACGCGSQASLSPSIFRGLRLQP